MARTKESVAPKSAPSQSLKEILAQIKADKDSYRKRSVEETLWPDLGDFAELQEERIPLEKIVEVANSHGHSFSASQVRASLAKWQKAKDANGGKPVADYASATKLLEKSPPAPKAGAGGQKPAAQPHQG